MADKNKDATQLFDGTVSAPSLAFTGDQDTGIYRVSANVVGVTAQGVQVVKVDGNTTSAATGVSITSAAAGSRVAVAALSSGTNEGIDIDAKGSGTIRLGNTSTGDVVMSRGATIAGTVTVTSTSASALTVGRQGATDPVLKLDASASTVATGVSITGAAAGTAPGIAAISSGTNEGLDINGKGTGAVRLANTSTGVVQAGNATNPALKVTLATAGTGINITSAAAAAGVAVAAISSGTNENMTLDAKGSGTITINGTATGNIVLGAAATGVSLSVTGGLTSLSGTAVPATAGAVAAGAPITCFSSGWKLWVTSDAPSHTATKGDLCINTGGSSTSTRLYVNNGTTNWIAITTAS